MNMYYDPEKFGLETVGEIDWIDESYEFDLTAVWRRKCDGQLLYADDSGCSCPSPFEDHGMNDLIPASPAELQVHLESRARDGWRPAENLGMQIANLMARVVS